MNKKKVPIRLGFILISVAFTSLILFSFMTNIRIEKDYQKRLKVMDILHLWLGFSHQTTALLSSQTILIDLNKWTVLKSELTSLMNTFSMEIKKWGLGNPKLNDALNTLFDNWSVTSAEITMIEKSINSQGAFFKRMSSTGETFTAGIIDLSRQKKLSGELYSLYQEIYFFDNFSAPFREKIETINQELIRSVRLESLNLRVSAYLITILILIAVVFYYQTVKLAENNERKYRELAECLPQTVFEMDLKGNLRFVNETGLELFRYSHYDFESGLNVFDMIVPEDRMAAQSNFQNRIRGGPPENREFKAVSKDKRVFPINIYATPIFQDNKVTGMRGVLIDITERKKNEQQTQEERDFLDTVLRSITDGVISTDMDGVIKLVNKSAEDMTGWLSSEMLKHPICTRFNLYHIKSHKQVKYTQPEDIIQAFGSASDILVQLSNRTGKRIIITLTLSPILDNNSQPIGKVFIFKDITLRQKLEENLIRTSKLDSIGILAGGIAHDFNNILTVILGNISLAKYNLNPSDKLFETLDKAETASERARSLTQQLLTLSKGGNPIKTTASIQELIQETVEFSLQGSNIRFNYQIPNTIWNVEADPGQIHQVINNIVINSRQAMPDGGEFNADCENIVITDSKEVSELKPGHYVKISFRDNGPGLDPEIIPKIFDPYFTTKKNGHGLGLATAYSIIKKHGGVIQAISVPDSGAQFIFYLPATMKKHAAKAGEPIVDNNCCSILVLEDDESIISLLQDAFNSSGYSYLFTREGSETLLAYQAGIDEGRPYDIVLLDLTIPGGMGGVDTMAGLLKINDKVKAIASSGYSNDSVMARYKEFGFKACLAKPYRVQNLFRLIEEVHVMDT